MKARHTIALGVVFAALTALYVYTGTREARVQREAAEAKRVFDFTAADISTLSIAQQGGVPVEGLRGEAGVWRIAAPADHIAAYQPIWNQLAETVAGMMNQRTLESSVEDPAAFALEDPRLSVIVGTADGTLQQVAFGDLDPTQRHRYTRIGDGEIFLTNAETFSRLNRSLLDLRDRRIFTHLDEGLTRIDYERLPTEARAAAAVDDPEVARRTTAIDESYAVTDDGEWRLVEPVYARARQDRLERLAQILRSLGGREFIDDPESLADYGLDPPFSRLTAHAPDGTTQTLLLGWIADDPENAGMFVKRTNNPSIIVVDARLLTLLPSEPEDFREKRLFTRKAARLKTVRYRDGSSSLRLENTADGWRLVEPAARDTDQVAVSMYIGMLKQIEGKSFPDVQNPPGFDPPRIQLDFTYDDGSAPSRIAVGAPVPGSDPMRIYARQDFGTLTTISFDDFRMVQTTAFDFRVKALFPFRREWVEELDLTFEGTRYRFRFAEGRWIVIEPEGRQLETQSDLRALIDAFIQTQAQDIAEPAPSVAVQGMTEPILEATFRFAPSAPMDGPLGPVRVGNRKTPASRERFLTLAGRDEVYFVDQGLVDDVRQALQGVVPVD